MKRRDYATAKIELRATYSRFDEYNDDLQRKMIRAWLDGEPSDPKSCFIEAWYEEYASRYGADEVPDNAPDPDLILVE